MILTLCLFFHCLFRVLVFGFFFFFKQKTAYEMRISDWSSDVCSSDLALDGHGERLAAGVLAGREAALRMRAVVGRNLRGVRRPGGGRRGHQLDRLPLAQRRAVEPDRRGPGHRQLVQPRGRGARSEEHTSELQSLMRISYAVFCLKKKTKKYE